MAQSILNMRLLKLSSVLLRNSLNITNSNWLQCNRTLFVKASLGLDAFAEHRDTVKRQLGPIEAKFREKMSGYVNDDSASMIFTEDLKNIAHLAQDDKDLDLVVKMLKKFNSQNKQLRFGNFVFGPVIMRLFHMLNKPQVAIDCFKDPAFDGVFDQLVTYQIFLDLLYENGLYEDVLSLFEIIVERQVDMAKYPRNSVVLVMASCYKLNTPKSLDHALKLWMKLADAGHFPMRRAATFCAGLALNQGKPEVTLEILGAVTKPNYVSIRNLRAAALSDIGRVDDAIAIFQAVIQEDLPKLDTQVQTFNEDVFEKVRAAVEKLNDSDVTIRFKNLEKIFIKQDIISKTTLDELLCCEIQRPPNRDNNRQENRFSRYDRRPRDPEFVRRVSNGGRQRPSLKDMV